MRPERAAFRASILAICETAALAGLCGPAPTWAQAGAVDLTKSFEVDKGTVCLFHLDDVAAGQVKDAVQGGKPGKAVDAKEAEGKFGKAMGVDGSKRIWGNEKVLSEAPERVGASTQKFVIDMP